MYVYTQIPVTTPILPRAVAPGGIAITIKKNNDNNNNSNDNNNNNDNNDTNNSSSNNNSDNNDNNEGGQWELALRQLQDMRRESHTAINHHYYYDFIL